MDAFIASLLLRGLDVLAVIPVVLGPLQVLLALLPAILIALFGVAVSLLRPRALRSGVRLLWRLKLSVAAIVVCVIAGMWGLAAVWPARGAAPRDGATVGRDWPLLRGDAARTGAVPGDDGPTSGAVRWAWREGREAYFSSPAVVGNRVYATSAVFSVLGNGTGAIYCLDADTGELIWKSAPPGYRATFSSPVVSGDYLVCGEGLHFVRDARVVCLDLRPGREGDVRWTLRTNSHVECTPVIANGRVYVGAGDDGYYCVELEPDANGSPRIVWHLDGVDYPDAETSVAVHEGRVYAGLGVGGRALCVLDAATGAEIHRLPAPYPVFSPPAIAAGKLYVGMGVGDYVQAAEDLDAEPAGEVWCVDLARVGEDGYRYDWRATADRTILGAIAVRDDEVYFGSRDGHIYCHDTSGARIAKWNVGASIVTAPAVTDAHVYVIAQSGVLFGLERRTLRPVWEIVVGRGSIGNEPMFISSPAVARGHVYVGSRFEGLVCAGAPGEPLAPIWPGELGGPGRGGNVDGVPIPDAGAFDVQYPADRPGSAEDVIAAPVAVLDGRVFAPIATGLRRGLVCLGATSSDGAMPWLWSLGLESGVHASPAVVDRRVFFVDGVAGNADRRLRAVDVETGAVEWEVPIAVDASGRFAASRTRIVVDDAARRSSCYRLDGEVVWSQATRGLAMEPWIDEARIVAVVEDGEALLMLDAETGRELWRRQLAARATTPPVVRDLTIFYGSEWGIDACSLIDGEPRAPWDGNVGRVVRSLVFVRDRIAAVTAVGQLVVVDVEAGRVETVLQGARPDLPPAAVRGCVLFFGDASVLRLDLSVQGAKAIEWVETSWFGAPTGPMVVAESAVWVGMKGWGLMRFGAAR